jgi:hypothetical protein
VSTTASAAAAIATTRPVLALIATPSPTREMPAPGSHRRMI